MLKLPLKTPIMLITSGGKYLGNVIYATDESITIVDVFEQYYDETGQCQFAPLGDKIVFDRSSITGYKKIDENNEYSNWRVQMRRAQMHLVVNNEGDINERNSSNS